MEESEDLTEGTVPSRRAFLAGAAGLTGVALASGVWAAPALAQTTDGAALADPSATAARPGGGGGGGGGGVVIDLTLDGVSSGEVSSFEGGMPVGDPVVLEKAGDDKIVRKHLAGVKYEDISVACGTGMSKGFYTWIKDTLDSKPSRKSGAVTATNAQTGAFRTTSFQHALLTEIGMPALDAASKDACKMTIKMTPESTTRQAGSGGGGGLKAKQKQWLCSNFRLSIGNLDCTKVNKIDSFTIKQAVVEFADGTSRIPTKEPTHLEIPNLVVTLSEASSQTWNQWLDDFVVKGNNGSESEKTGTLDYLASDGTTLFTLTFGHLGIFKLTPDKVEAGAETIRRVKAEMYCETMTFTRFPGS